MDLKFQVHGCLSSIWILPERLNGQNVQIKSVFHPSERTPSMWVFVDKGQYKFKDFSTGKGGNKIDLVKELFSIDLL